MAVLLITPLIFLLIEAFHAGFGDVASLIGRSLTARLLWNTVRLTVVVSALCTLIGVGTAWLTERTDLPGRRVWVVLLLVPLAVPDFVVSFGWASLSQQIAGFKGAVLVMTLAVYPLVYLPVASSLRNADPALEEVSRSLGVGRVQTWWRVTVGQARVAILGGCLLVTLVILAEYGAFEILSYQTFTTEIFTEFQAFRVPTACASSLVLVAVGLIVLGGETAGRGRARVSRTDRMAQRLTGRHRLGQWTLPALAFMSLVVALALGVPIASAAYWWVAGAKGLIQGGMSIVGATWHTAMYSASAALLATVMALPVAILVVRHRSREAPAGAHDLPRARHAGSRHCTFAGLFQRELCERDSVANGAHAGGRLYDNVLPARSGRRQGIGFPGPASAGGSCALPGQAPPRGLLAGDAPARHPRAGGRVLPGFPFWRHRADGDIDPRANRRTDIGNSILAVPAKPRLRAGSSVRLVDDRARRRANLCAGPLFRPPPSSRFDLVVPRKCPAGGGANKCGQAQRMTSSSPTASPWAGTSTVTVSPSLYLPSSNASARLSPIVRWMSRLRGRAPYTGS